jgi:antitoxin ParD1/3/4
MHISLTPELETQIKQKVASGFYNNASEVIRDALRFWEKNEELVQHMKLEMLKERLLIGADQAKQGEFVEQSVAEIVSEIRNA